MLETTGSAAAAHPSFDPAQDKWRAAAQAMG
jgi:hypothetical protein